MSAMNRRKSLGRDWAWPLNAADLRDGLGDMFDAVSIVWYETAKPGEDVAWVGWKPDSSRTGQFFADASSASVWLVPATSQKADAIGDLMRAQVLPEMADWLREAFERDEAWQALHHSKKWMVEDGKVVTRT